MTARTNDALAPQPKGTADLEGQPLQSGSPRPFSFYRPELDVLRFFAFLAVFVTHAFVYRTDFLLRHHLPVWLADSLPRIFVGGVYGVDLFFALSAYLITELLLREKDQRGVLDVKAFYLRRILRIWPLYYFFLALAFAVPFLNPDREFSVRYLAMFALLSGNWSFTFFGWHAGPVVFPLWSVSVEEQFYLLWPPIVARLTRRRIAIAAGVLIVVANADRFWQFTRHSTPQHLWGDTFAHLDTIAVGILVSVFLKGLSPRISLARRLAMIGSGLACFIAVGSFMGPEANRPPIALPMLAGYVVVAVACLSILVGFIGLDLRFGRLVYLGKISYGLYVYHAVCIFLVDKVSFLNHAFISEGVALALTIALAAASYNLLEKPFLKLKERWAHVRSRPV